jgi:hypothetical protein
MLRTCDRGRWQSGLASPWRAFSRTIAAPRRESTRGRNQPDQGNLAQQRLPDPEIAARPPGRHHESGRCGDGDDVIVRLVGRQRVAQPDPEGLLHGHGATAVSEQDRGAEAEVVTGADGYDPAVAISVQAVRSWGHVGTLTASPVRALHVYGQVAVDDHHSGVAGVKIMAWLTGSRTAPVESPTASTCAAVAQAREPGKLQARAGHQGSKGA